MSETEQITIKSSDPSIGEFYIFKDRREKFRPGDILKIEKMIKEKQIHLQYKTTLFQGLFYSFLIASVIYLFQTLKSFYFALEVNYILFDSAATLVFVLLGVVSFSIYKRLLWLVPKTKMVVSGRVDTKS